MVPSIYIIWNHFVYPDGTYSVPMHFQISFVFRFWEFFQCCLSEWFKMLLSKKKIVSMKCERSARTTTIVCAFLNFQNNKDIFPGFSILYWIIQIAKVLFHVLCPFRNEDWESLFDKNFYPMNTVKNTMAVLKVKT